MSHSFKGILISRGVRLRIKGLKITLGKEGSDVSQTTFQVSLTTCPFWLEIALNHLDEAGVAREAVLAAERADDAKALGVALEREFLSGMQAVVGAATAIDAFYASVRECSAIPRSMSDAWRKNGTARHVQVTEVLRQMFRLKQRGAANLGQVLREVYRFRDLAVHPSADFSSPVLHAEIQRGVEWRFVAFGFPNARQIVRGSLASAWLLAKHYVSKAPQDFADLCCGIRSLTEPLVARWGAKYGPLTDEEKREPEKTEAQQIVPPNAG